MPVKTTADTELLAWCPDKISLLQHNISVGRPYVWDLRLSLDNYETLESALKKSIDSHNNDYRHLLCEEYSLYIVIYLAEWYKRYYKGRDIVDENKVVSLTTPELERLYGYAHIDTNTFVYNASTNPDRPSKRWAESLQILGGLAIQAEIKRDTNDPLLVQLCKIFHGEDICLDEVRDRNRAVAFQESIFQRHSLFEYLECILDREKEAPFNKEDIRNEDTLIPEFLKRIELADSLAKKDKFEFEWIISYIGNLNLMVRHLKVKLKPEVLGGGKKQYIGYDRLKRPEWGIDSPEEIGRIRFYLRFKKGKHCVQKEGYNDEPIFKYDNTGSEKTGFLSVCNLDENIYTNIPIYPFDKVEIVMKYDSVERIVQTLEVKDYMQVYALPKTGNKFSSRRNSQAATAVIFSSEYHLADAYKDNSVVYARFKRNDELSEEYCWCPINDKIIIENSKGEEILPPFFNRNGLYQVVTKKYLNTIKYKDNIYVTYKYIDVDYDEDEVQEDYVPILFGRQGLEVLHYVSRECKDGTRVHDYDLEWLKNGSYIDWKTEEPGQGFVKLRITVKGIVFRSSVYYVPYNDNGTQKDPIWRDFENIKICSSLANVEDIQDKLPSDLNSDETDTKEVEIGNDYSKVLVEVYRPFILRELSYKNLTEGKRKTLKFYGKEEKIHIPLLCCENYSIRDFSEKGVHEYTIDNKDSLYYKFTTINDPSVSGASFLEEITAQGQIDNIPLDYLKIYITKAVDKPHNLFAWNYKDEPSAITSTSTFSDEGIIFQSRIDGDTCLEYCMPTIKLGKSGWGGKKGQTEIDIIKCFDTVVKHKTYFFLFKPLIKIVSEKKQIASLFLPLLKERNFNLDYQDIMSLSLFARQFHFDWLLLPRESWIKELQKLNEEEREKASAVIMDFFAQSQNCADSHEKTCLEEFLNVYWTFNLFSKIDSVAEVALKLILNDGSALGKYSNLRDFLRDYDACKHKFSEMSKALTTKN